MLLTALGYFNNCYTTFVASTFLQLYIYRNTYIDYSVKIDNTSSFLSSDSLPLLPPPLLEQNTRCFQVWWSMWPLPVWQCLSLVSIDRPEWCWKTERMTSPSPLASDTSWQWVFCCCLRCLNKWEESIREVFLHRLCHFVLDRQVTLEFIY